MYKEWKKYLSGAFLFWGVGMAQHHEAVYTVDVYDFWIIFINMLI